MTGWTRDYNKCVKNICEYIKNNNEIKNMFYELQNNLKIVVYECNWEENDFYMGQENLVNKILGEK